MFIMKKSLTRIFSIFMLVTLVAGCANGNENTEESEGTHGNIVTSIYPVYEIVQQVAGDRLDVSLMVGETEDAHHFEPSAQAVAAVNDADAFIYSSSVMEFWAEDLLSVIENEQLVQLEMAESLNLSLGQTEDESDDTSSEAEERIEVNGLSDHYHTGDTIELEAETDSEFDHWHWFTRESTEEEWQMDSEQMENTFTTTASVDQLEIKAELYDNEHNLQAESEIVTIHIDDHEHEQEHEHNHDHSDADVEQSIQIQGLAGHYHTGDLIELQAEHEVDDDHWHWFTKEPDAEEWELVDGQFSDTFSTVASINGLEVKAELYNDDHQLIAESEPVVIEIDDHEGDHEHPHNHASTTETLDPHFWLDPVAVKEVLPAIVETLSEVDPDGIEIYEENATIFSEELDELDTAYQETFQEATNRSFIVQHQAFGHLAYRYHLNQVSVGGLITEVEPDPHSVINVIEFIDENDIPVIYYQSGENSATAESIAAETNTEVATLFDLERRPTNEDFEDNLYIEAMYYNLEQLQKSIH